MDLKRAATKSDALAYSCGGGGRRSPTPPERQATSFRFSDLPSALLRHGVFAFLVQSPDQPTSLVHGFDKYDYRAVLEPLRHVCRDWRHLSDSLLSMSKTWLCDRTLCEFVGETALLESVRGGGERVLQLELRMAAWYLPLPTMEDQRVWNSFFTHLPNVVRLDLSAVSDHMVPRILNASSTTCPNVKDLVFKSRHYGKRNDTEEVVLTAALSEALERWHTTNGGLRALTIPHWATRDDARYLRFLVVVADWCPDMQFLRGWNRSWFITGGVYFTPKIGPDDWQAFRRKCPGLRCHTTWPGVWSAVGVRL